MSDQGISEAFVAAVEAVGRLAGIKPLPKGLTTVASQDWTLTINTMSGPLLHEGSEVPPFTVLAVHKRYLIICMLAPDGGMIGGGMSEAEFIADMKAIADQVPA